MIFDKRFVMATALVLGFGMAACGGDEDCSGNGTKGEDGKCTCNEGYEANEAGDDCVVKEDNGNGGGDEDCSGNGTKGEDGKCTCNEGYVANEAGDDCVVKEDNGNGEGEGKTCEGENEEYNEGAQDCVCKEGFYRPNKDNTKACIAKPNAELCGNGEIDEGELCDVGVDKNNNGEDDKVLEAAVCSDYKKDVEWQDGGKPGCSTDCMNYSQGSCKSTDHVDDVNGVVNGVVSCDATITYDEETKKATANATVVSKDNLPVKGTVICANSSLALGGLVADVTLVDATDGNLEAHFDASAQTDAGEYACTVYVEVEDKGVFCTAEGLKVLTDVNNIGEIALANYTVESQVTADTIAKWTFATQTGDTIEEAVNTGINPDEGTATSLVLKWLGVGENASKIQLGMTIDVNHTEEQRSLTAFQVQSKGVGNLGTFSEDSTTNYTTASHISISDLSTYDVASVSMTAKYNNGGKMYITESDGTSEKIVGKLDVKASYETYTVENFSENAKEINIYGDNASDKGFAFDDITIMGAAK